MIMTIYFLYKTNASRLKTTVVRDISCVAGAPLFEKIKDKLLLESKQLVFLLLPVQGHFRRILFNRKVWISVVLFALLTGLIYYLSCRRLGFSASQYSEGYAEGDLLNIVLLSTPSGLDHNFLVESGILGINNPNEIINTSLLLLISKGIKKLPDWLKFLFFLISLGLFFLKLFGYNIIDIIIDDSLLIYIIYGYSSLAISYFLLHLYLLQKFYKAKVNIPEILPQFIIDWLEGIKILASNEVGFKTNKETVYLNLIVYIIIVFLVTIFK